MDTMSLSPNDPRHGTRNGYTNLGCRCDACREAHRQHFIEYRAKNPQLRKNRCPQCGWWKIVESVVCMDCARGDPPAHGDIAMYRRGCHCQECRGAEARRKRDYRKRIRAGAKVRVRSSG